MAPIEEMLNKLAAYVAGEAEMLRNLRARKP
jgi:hypothetical protein